MKTLEIEYGFVVIPEIEACGYRIDNDVHVDYKYKVYVYLKSGKSYLVDRYTNSQAALDRVREIEILRDKWN